MISIDTNIIVRLLTNDDPTQVKKAKKLLSDNDVFVTKTVMLETAWVLIYSYDIEKAVAINSLLKFTSLPNVVVENFNGILHAFSLANEGMDISDAIHLTCSDVTDHFATFDKQFIKVSKKLAVEMTVFSP